MRYIYLISFSVRRDRENRIYSGEYDFPKPITTIEQIVVRLDIEKGDAYPISFQLLRTEEE